MCSSAEHPAKAAFDFGFSQGSFFCKHVCRVLFGRLAGLIGGPGLFGESGKSCSSLRIRGFYSRSRQGVKDPLVRSTHDGLANEV